MAEGLSHDPNEAQNPSPSNEVAPGLKRPETGDRFKNFLGELFKPKADKEKKATPETDEKDSDTEKSEKKSTSETVAKSGRFSRAWRSLFPKVASRENVPLAEEQHASAERPRSLFFESSDVAPEQEGSVVDESELVLTTPENPLPNASVAQPEYAGVQQRSVVVESKTNEQDRPQKASQETGSLSAAHAEQDSPLMPEQAVPQATATAEVQPRTASVQEVLEQPSTLETNRQVQATQQEMYARQQEAALPLAQPEQAPVRPMSTAPERVVVAGLTSTDRLRMRQMERREKDIEKHTRAIKKDLERRPQSPNTIRPRVESAPTYVDRTVTRTPEVVPRTAEKQTIREIQKEIVNKRIDLVSEREEVNTAEAFKATEKVSDVQKERIIESMYDKVDTKEVEDHKEITYELSHEAKDMDGQTAAAWNAMQASADAQAKANAAAIAAAHAAVGDQADNLKQVAKNQAAAMYKQAALGGFVAAVVIIAIIIAILLLQSK